MIIFCVVQASPSNFGHIMQGISLKTPLDIILPKLKIPCGLVKRIHGKTATPGLVIQCRRLINRQKVGLVHNN